MDTNYTLLLLLSPLVGFIFNTLVGKNISKYISGAIATIAVIISFSVSCYFFSVIGNSSKEIQISLFNWIEMSNFKINFSFLLDQLSIIWLLFLTGIGALIHLYSISYMYEDENFHKFFAYLNLFIFFMILLVIGGNLLVTFIGWEGVGLCSYLLIGFWHKNQDYNNAAKKAFIMNRIGDLGFLLGIFVLANIFSTIEFSSLKEIILTTHTEGSFWINTAVLLLFIGACGKSAQIPLYTWLPDAMAGPTPVSALIHAATMVTAGIFIITRLNFLFDLAPSIQNIIVIVGASTALIAATIGVFQNDIKKVLAYSTVSQLGLMFLALGLGAYEVAVFHVITHAFFKACLFLGAGSVIHGLGGEQDMRKMGGLRKKMPITYITMLIASLAIAGIFPLAGFWSKDEILMAAFHNSYILWGIASFASILTAFYMFRLLFLTFFNDFRGTEEQKHHLHESPLLITFPLIVLAILSFIGGFISLPGNSWLNQYLMSIIPDLAKAHHSLEITDILLMILALLFAVAAIAFAYSKYIKQKQVPCEDEKITGVQKIIYNKYYIDEIYDFVIIKPINISSRFFINFLETNISLAINTLGKITMYIGEQGKTLQNGSVRTYLFIFVIGMSVILTYLFLT